MSLTNSYRVVPPLHMELSSFCHDPPSHMSYRYSSPPPHTQDVIDECTESLSEVGTINKNIVSLVAMQPLMELLISA